MKIELDYTERNLLLDLLREEEASITSGFTHYGDNKEVLETIRDLLDKLEEE